MDRTDELVSLFAIHGYSTWHERELQQKPLQHPEFHRLERSAATQVKSNSQELLRMGKLIQRKEFSNDPTMEVNEISEKFQRKLVSIKRDLETLSNGVEESKRRGRGRGSAHTEQHWTLVLSGLQKQVTADIATFQDSLRQHGQQVQQRESRVTKFGQGSDQVRRGQQQGFGGQLGSGMAGRGGYALFAPPPPVAPPRAGSGGVGQVAPPRPSGRNQGVIRRRNNAGGAPPVTRAINTSAESGGINSELSFPGGVAEEANNSKSEADKGRNKYFSVAFPTYGGGGNSGEQQLQQEHRRNNMHRNEQSRMVEESIGKMGQLFSQMSSLVLAQAETIQRIEDDVEAGLEDTTDAHTDLVYVHEITKGNRGLILKIFALLIFFILLFMVWT